jgi:hypothetical protein
MNLLPITRFLTAPKWGISKVGSTYFTGVVTFSYEISEIWEISEKFGSLLKFSEILEKITGWLSSEDDHYLVL